ncbi:MAG TPA: murein biosynthesis integral membrane protein MurJ [Sutterella sp.]|nr:murein biosynthesis integral membrane protein MurJ [Sutterella sp.]
MGLLKATATVSSLTLVSRVTGLIRDMLIARYFGASIATDAFYVAFRLPNMFRRLFGEGAFQQAFVPMLSDVKAKHQKEDVKSFVDKIFTVLAAALITLSLLGVIAAPILVWIIASGFQANPEGFDLAVLMTRYLFPYIFCMSLVAMSAGVLNTYGHFAVPAATPVLLNLSFIVCTLFLSSHLERPIFALMIAVIAGGIAQLAFQIPFLAKIGMLPKWTSVKAALSDAAVKRVLTLMLPALFGVGVAQLSLLINTNIASRLAAGSVTWLSFADRLMEFPTAILGVALGTVLLPSLSSAFAKGNTARYNALLDHGLRLVVLFAVPASVGLGMMAQAFVSLLYQGIHFSVFDVQQTSVAVMGYSFGLSGLIAIKILAPAFYAQKDIRTPVKIAAVSLLAVQLCNCVTVPLFAHAGLAISVGTGSVLNAGLLLFFLFKRGTYQPLAGWGKWFAAIVCATVLMAAYLFFIQEGIDWAGMQDVWDIRALLVIAITAGACVIYFGVFALFGFRLRDLRPKRDI